MKTLVLVLLLSLSAQAQHSRAKKFLEKMAEHVSLGAGIEAGMYQIAGGSSRRRLAVGLSTAALVAGFKEGSDAVSGADTKKQALVHALSIMLGAGAATAIKH